MLQDLDGILKKFPPKLYALQLESKLYLVENCLGNYSVFVLICHLKKFIWFPVLGHRQTLVVMCIVTVALS